MDYRGPNVVERRFNLPKQWRGLGTRYDTLGIVDRSAVPACPDHLDKRFVRHAFGFAGLEEARRR
ncbi:hypothetical protein [Amycolatopsis thermophila]|uniref:Uncharacterized protein n=1 Tax=Amycolatopsis thermophila TaxID=206084 RepID=A0ABU0ETL2_9PSEU|nr:hypothetical protein [Amycolatopsis thermophila]